MSLTDRPMNSELYVLFSGAGTANYEPCPFVANFLQKRERGCRELDITMNN
jgi:hypothetical protein